jgi:hypothetical protein
VTVVDRDSLPPGADSRRGVPQSAHPHALLAVGREALEQLFPGLTDELVELGARWIDVAGDARVWQLGGYRLRVDCGVSMLCLSRRCWRTAYGVACRRCRTWRSGRRPRSPD